MLTWQVSWFFFPPLTLIAFVLCLMSFKHTFVWSLLTEVLKHVAVCTLQSFVEAWIMWLLRTKLPLYWNLQGAFVELHLPGTCLSMNMCMSESASECVSEWIPSCNSIELSPVSGLYYCLYLSSVLQCIHPLCFIHMIKMSYNYILCNVLEQYFWPFVYRHLQYLHNTLDLCIFCL